ncbi:hypothetical protein VTN02DRAFT_5297 [Thermoascus thermophilus]
MARIITLNGPLGLNQIFRKRDAPRAPFHARWGDVAITVPTEGSWCQFDQPHRRPHQTGRRGGGRQQSNVDDDYGPGEDYRCSRFSEDQTEEEDDDGFADAVVLTTIDYENAVTTAGAASSGKRPPSLSIPILKPRRRRRVLGARSASAFVSSRRISSHGGTATSTSTSSSTSDREGCHHGGGGGGGSGGGFVYKPVHPQDYTEEVERRASGHHYCCYCYYRHHQNKPSLSSVPASERYLEEEFITTVRPETRGNATGVSRDHSAKPSVDDGDDEKDLQSGSRASSRSSSRQTPLEVEKKPWNPLSFVSDPQKQTSLTTKGGVSGKKNKNENSNGKNRISRAATVTMVSDPEDLYG